MPKRCRITTFSLTSMRALRLTQAFITYRLDGGRRVNPRASHRKEAGEWPATVTHTQRHW
jgi:hypothetical protein